ncbi:MAG: hypothetical protein ACO3JL_01940 [Myxococcota bacterium]
MTRVLSLCLGLLALVSCAEASPGVVLPVGQARLAVTSPGLLAPIASFLVVLFGNGDGEHPCEALVEEGPSALRQRGPLALQVLGVEGEALLSEHTFGQIDPDTPHSVVLLGSLHSREQLQADVSLDPLQAAQGSVIAIGCEEFDAAAYQRLDIPITLFPAGQR